MRSILSLPLSILCLLVAVIIYALFGSPTPDSPGVVEALIGVFLVFSVVAAGVSGGISFEIGRNLYLQALQVFFLAGLILPTLAGVYFGNDYMLMGRDLIAFFFLGLPLFLSAKTAAREGVPQILSYALVFAGFMFAVRTLLPAFNVWIPEGELLYLSNSPLALFAAVLVAVNFFYALEDLKFSKVWYPALLLAVLCVLLAAMLLDVQRATIGAVIISVVIVAIWRFVEAPKSAIKPILIIAILCAMAYPLIGETMEVMAQKTAAVGFNMRTQEAMAVYEYLAAAPETLFVGRGWGASFASPAVGGLDVNYTHSLLTTMALKGGIVMLLLTILVVVAGVYQIILIFQRDRGMGFALLWPLLVPVVLYASHKSLDFGLLLLLIGVWSVHAGALHHKTPSVKNQDHI